jgi:hypothetical protein
LGLELELEHSFRSIFPTVHAGSPEDQISLYRPLFLPRLFFAVQTVSRCLLKDYKSRYNLSFLSFAA